jgi:hypothetical protein
MAPSRPGHNRDGRGIASDRTDMDHVQHNAIVNFIWGIADDVLRDVYVRGKYRDVILPTMTCCIGLQE